jgi:V/A-type H+-transporting ATPase subunit E
MALEGILEKINKNVEEEIRAIKEEGRLKRQEIVARAESQAKGIGERILDEASRKVELDRRQSTVSAELEHRKEILTEKQKLLEDCFQAALEELVSLPAAEYQSLIRRMLLNLATTGDERVLISTEDEKRIDQKFVDGVNEELKKTGRGGGLKLDGTSPDVRGGFVLRTEDVEVDCSFGTLLRQLREELQSQVAAILFGDKK